MTRSWQPQRPPSKALNERWTKRNETFASICNHIISSQMHILKLARRYMSRLRVIPFVITFFTDSDTEQFQWDFGIQQSNHSRLRKLRFRVQ